MRKRKEMRAREKGAPGGSSFWGRWWKGWGGLRPPLPFHHPSKWRSTRPAFSPRALFFGACAIVFDNINLRNFPNAVFPFGWIILLRNVFVLEISTKSFCGIYYFLKVGRGGLRPPLPTPLSPFFLIVFPISRANFSKIILDKKY